MSIRMFGNLSLSEKLHAEQELDDAVINKFAV